MHTPQYIHLKPKASLETIEISTPFAAVVLIDVQVSSEWRAMVSEWLVENGCLYMMAWGNECSLWDDSVDTANLEAHNWKHIPEEKLVTTTWHDDESIQDIFCFAMTSLPYHPNIKSTFIFDIVETPPEQTVLAYYLAAKTEMGEEVIAEVIMNNDTEKFPPEPIFKKFFLWILDRLTAVL